MGDTPPFTYEYINQSYGTRQPCFMHIANTGLARMFKRYLMQDALSVFQFTLPETWDQDYFRYILLGWGYIAILKTDMFGVIPQQCTLAGYNVFYKPNKCNVANPLLKPVTLSINNDCALIKLMPDYGNLADLVDCYGDMMALAYETASINILNSRVSFVFSADGKTEADTFKALYDSIASGDPSVVYRKKAANTAMDKKPWDTFSQNVGQNFIAGDILETLRCIRDQFLTQIGIPNLSTRKKERVNLMESGRNVVQTVCKSQLWLEELKAGIDKAVEMFPELDGKLDVKLRYAGVIANAGEAIDSSNIQL